MASFRASSALRGRLLRASSHIKAKATPAGCFCFGTPGGIFYPVKQALRGPRTLVRALRRWLLSELPALCADGFSPSFQPYQSKSNPCGLLLLWHAWRDFLPRKASLTGAPRTLVRALRRWLLSSFQRFARTASHRASSHIKAKATPAGCFCFGTPGGIRTPDLLVRSQSLYPAELQAHLDCACFLHAGVILACLY